MTTPAIDLLLARILENAGHRVQEAARGDQAYDMMVKETTDLAISRLEHARYDGS